MKEFNLIAVLGLYLICSPQAFGHNGDYFASRMAIESPKESRCIKDRIYKIHPYQKVFNPIQRPSSRTITLIDAVLIRFYSTKPMFVNFRQFTRPKIIDNPSARFAA